MKGLLLLLFFTFSLGTGISLHLRPESLFYLPLYALALFHVYRLNISEGFFLVFLKSPEKEEIAKVRLGPSQIDMQDEGDRSEDKFLSLFDWKKSTVRKIISWAVFCLTIYLLFFRMHLDISDETIVPAVAALFLMRVVAVGHFLVPLAMNLFFVMKDIPEYQVPELVLVFVYGALLIANLALIYPSEERLKNTLKSFPFRSAALLIVTFMAGLFLFPKEFEKKNSEVPQLDISRSEKNLQGLNSKLQNLMGNGLMRNPEMKREAESLRQDVKDFNQKEDRSPEEWKNLREREEKLSQKFNEELRTSSTPPMTKELLQMMKNDLESRSSKGIDPETFKKMESLLERVNNFKGGNGDDLLADYRELKYCKNGYYSEETEMDAGGAPDPVSEALMKKMAEAAMKKKEVSDQINKNIEKLNSSPDEGLQSVNDALKKELNETDSLSPDDMATLTKDIQKSNQDLTALKQKTTDPELAKKLAELMENNQRLLNQVSPHMKAQEKSDLAQKLEKQKESAKSLRNDVRGEVAEKVAAKEKIWKQRDEEREKKESKVFEKTARMISITAIMVFLMWVWSLFKKKGVKKVRGVSEEAMEDIREKLLDVRKRKLSPREEVIETYNVLHDGLHELVFIRETPPSCIVYEGLSAAEPGLKAPVYKVTDIFARTLYGESDVSAGDLKDFRRNVSTVFTYFGIQG